jgi:hypothetical protein
MTADSVTVTLSNVSATARRTLVVQVRAKPCAVSSRLPLHHHSVPEKLKQAVTAPTVRLEDDLGTTLAAKLRFALQLS